MRKVFAALAALRSGKSLGALVGLFSVMLFIGLTVHVAHCPLQSDHHTIQQTSRQTERAFDISASRSINAVTVAADGNGKQQVQVAALAVPYGDGLQSATLSPLAPSYDADSRNTALAHRKLIVLLI
jgi:hypothetical protein